MELREFFEHLSGARRVYGEPYERDGSTVIPALSVRTAGGFGTGEVKDRVSSGAGGGGAATARPVGAYVVRDGKVSWEPAIDVNRIVLGGQILLGLALIVYALRSGTRPEGRRGR
ncbi:spore germination protein GerW family protein [Sphaerisporangium sp. NPDC088356]|uniref:spore germination protein GerW family protein n=1 Tax=Sphaerisporangium sp. NPDC088356 TaxID=3154871 RepID=UPI00343A4C6C